ncbi:MAG: tetratricopeptide repeat protein [Bacteroidales bacterium]|nr:tetratricopeptide repeat protein [Bacteroidales bacterium]
MGKKKQKQIYHIHPVRTAEFNSSLYNLFKNKRLWILIILALTAIAYIPVFSNGLIDFWDDGVYITKNEIIKQLNLKKIFTAVYSGNYHPFVTLFNALEYHFFKLNPVVYHLNNLLIHLLNTFLVFKLIEIITKRNEIAIITSLFFGIHPMHVESVAWAAERKDVLYAFFYLLALINYIKYISVKEKHDRYFVYAIILFVCSLLSKSSAAAFPVLLLLVDWFYKRKFNFRLMLEKIPFFVIAVIFGIVALKTQKFAFSTDYINEHYAFYEKIFLSCYAVCLYFYKIILPFNLSIIYPYPERINDLLPIGYMSFVAVLVIAYFAYRSLKKTRYVVFGLAFFLITIALVLQAFPVGCFIFAERYSYVPYIGTFLLVGVTFSNIMNSPKKNAEPLKYVFVTILGLSAIACVILSFNRAGIWKNEEKLLVDAANKKPGTITWYYVGNSFYLNNEFEKANEYYSKCLRVDSNYSNLNKMRGIVNFNLNRFEDAIKDFNRAIRQRPDDTVAYLNRGNALSKIEKYLEALPDYDFYLKLKPDAGDAYLFRGVAYYNTNNFNEALKDFNKSLQINPKDSQTYMMRGMTYCQINKPEDALKDLIIAGKMYSSNFKVYCWRAWAYYALRDKDRTNIEKSIEDYSRALQLIPDDQTALVFRATAYKDLGKFDLAVKDAEKAKSLGYPLNVDSFRK